MTNVNVKSMFESTIKTVLSKHGKLFEFLSLVSRLYQFKTTNLILIYAQRPDAQMVKTIEGWNAHKRSLNENAHAITVLERKELRYVFDLNDTTGEDVFIEESTQSIKQFEMHINDIYNSKIHSYEKLLSSEKEGTLLEEIDDDLLPSIFESTVKAVATVIIENAFQINSSSVTPSDLKWVPSFNSTKLGYTLLSSSTFVAREVIKILKEVQEIETSVSEKTSETTESNLFVLAEEKIRKGIKENTPEKRVVDYLSSNLNNSLASRILLKEKSFKKCWQYVYEAAKKQAVNNMAMLEDQAVYDLAKKYFETDLESDNEKPIQKKEIKASSQNFIEKLKQEKLKKEQAENNQVSFLGGDF